MVRKPILTYVIVSVSALKSFVFGNRIPKSKFRFQYRAFSFSF